MDAVVPEPAGGAQTRSNAAAGANLRAALSPASPSFCR